MHDRCLPPPVLPSCARRTLPPSSLPELCPTLLDPHIACSHINLIAFPASRTQDAYWKATSMRVKKDRKKERKMLIQAFNVLGVWGTVTIMPLTCSHMPLTCSHMPLTSALTCPSPALTCPCSHLLSLPLTCPSHLLSPAPHTYSHLLSHASHLLSLCSVLGVPRAVMSCFRTRLGARLFPLFLCFFL